VFRYEFALAPEIAEAVLHALSLNAGPIWRNLQAAGPARHRHFVAAGYGSALQMA